MNAAPLSTQLPNLSDSQSGHNPAEFIAFLRSLNNDHLGDHCRRIASKDKDNWTTIVDGLVDHFLRSFYLPNTVSWDGVQERLEVTQATLEVIRRVFLRVDGIFTGSQELVRKIFVRLMDFCRVLDLWIGIAKENDGFSMLQQYREMVMSILISVLHGLGDNNAVPGQQQSACESLRELLKEGLEVFRGKVPSHSTLKFSHLECHSRLFRDIRPSLWQYNTGFLRKTSHSRHTKRSNIESRGYPPSEQLIKLMDTRTRKITLFMSLLTLPRKSRRFLPSFLK